MSGPVSPRTAYVTLNVPYKTVGASLAQLAEHALRKRMVVGSIPTGGFSEFEEPLGALGLNYFSGK